MISKCPLQPPPCLGSVILGMADVLSPSTEPNFRAHVLKISETEKECTAHCSALWEDSRNRYLYTEVLCTEYKCTHEMLNRNVLWMEVTYLPSLRLHRLDKGKCYFVYSPIMLYSNVERGQLQRLHHAVICMSIDSICQRFYRHVFKLLRKIEFSNC